MKKLYFSILSVLSVFTVSAQLTQGNNAPAASDTYTMFQCDTVSPGASGAGAMWNFASINTHSSIVKNFVALAVSTTTYPAANISLGSSASDVQYLASATNSLGYYGGNIAIGAVAGTITYTSPAIFASYPMSFNTTGSSATGGTLVASGQNGTFTGSSNVLADGTGTITLPGGFTFTNTMRVAVSQTMYIVTSLANATVTQVNYNYYAEGVKAPVFSISTSTAVLASLLGNSTSSQTFVTRNASPVVSPSTTVSFQENVVENLQFNVFPNPSVNYVNFVTNHPDAKLVSVYDITGKLVETQTLTEGKLKLDVSSYNKGLYLYSISTSGNKTLKSGKITVSQQ